MSKKPFYWYKPRRKNENVHRMIVRKLKEKQRSELVDEGKGPEFKEIMRRCRAYKGPPPWE